MASQAELERQLDRLRDDSGRYQAASRAALDQLDWVIDYLSRNHRDRLARQLRRNRASILRGMRSDTPPR